MNLKQNKGEKVKTLKNSFLWALIGLFLMGFVGLANFFPDKNTAHYLQTTLTYVVGICFFWAIVSWLLFGNPSKTETE